MKTRAYIGLSLGFALALTAPVSASATTTTVVDPVGLGSLDAVLNHCRQLNPGGAAAYLKLKVSIFGYLSAARRAALEATTQYKKGFNAVQGVLIYAPKDWARQSCLDLASSGGAV